MSENDQPIKAWLLSDPKCMGATSKVERATAGDEVQVMDPSEAEPKMLASVRKSHPDSYPWLSGSVVKVTATVPLETEMPLLAVQPETVSEIVMVSFVI